MKTQTALALLVAVFTTGRAFKLRESPVTKVVTLLQQLRGEIAEDGQREQKSYDKFACWCEETMTRKAADIASAKEYIETTQTLMTKLRGELGAHEAEIAQLKKDIAANLDAQREATDVREKDNAAYEGDKNEYEQSIGALEGAIRVLTGAGTGKGGFLETVQQAKLMSAAANLRRVLRTPAVSRWVSEKDLAALTRFLQKPEDFAAAKRHGLAAVQTGQNPFGDYAPQSTMIQGILKGMYEAFVTDLEKANAKEADQQKSYEELMATKKAEQATLEATLQKQESDHAEKSKLYADSKSGKDAAAAQLATDEVFFADTKDSCKAKASEWAERSRIRTSELASFDEALSVLDSPEARAVFASAAKSFLQLSNAVAGRQASAADMAVRRARAYAKLRALSAAHSHDLSIARLAVAVREAGHFDKVIAMIDQMVELIRKEEQDDIAHRDRCQNSMRASAEKMEDLEHLIEKTESELGRMADRVSQLREKVGQLERDMTATQADLDDRLAMRNREREDFERSLKDDTAAVGLLQQGLSALQAFYKQNNIPLSLAQKREDPAAPSYTIDPNKAPETEFKGAYGGRQEEHGTVVSIIESIIEDLQKEIQVAREMEAEAQRQYETDTAAMKAALKAQEDSKVAAEKDLADLQAKVVAKETFHTEKSDDLAAEREARATLERDCAWVQTHFDSRREKRKAELDGLAEAKSILAGVDAGDYNELKLSVAS